MSFSSFRLNQPLLRAITERGYTSAFPIQVKAIPAVLSGKDVMAAAQTGTGKTAAFTLPLLQRLSTGPRVRANHIRALVLVPTRELAMQVADAIATYGKYLPLTSAVVYGGVKINPQMMQLRNGKDILVATPGRLLDLFRQNAVNFEMVETLILDEADKMLDLGFSEEIRKILDLLPARRQNLLFSATFSNDIRTLTDKLLKKPVQIEVNPRNSAAKSVKQWVYEVDKSKKPGLLCHLLRNNDWQQVLAFVRTKNGADQLVKTLAGAGITALAIHGDKSQGARTQALAAFKANEIRVLVATDIASRGIDISELSHVINVDLPKVPEDYIHRIGRTGRAGMEGVAISLVSADEVQLLSAIETLIRQLLVREVETGYVPKHSVPLTQLKNPRQKKPKKPKKTQADQLTASDRTTNPRTRNQKAPRRGNTEQVAEKHPEAINGRRKNQKRVGGGSTTNTAHQSKAGKNNTGRKR
jgi:ATP-dependent RNA helicase RhlE